MERFEPWAVQGSTGRRNNPDPQLRDLQREACIQLLADEIEALQPQRVLAGSRECHFGPSADFDSLNFWKRPLEAAISAAYALSKE
jgi:hypothetical protein